MGAVEGRLLDALGELELLERSHGLVGTPRPFDRDVADLLGQEAEVDVASLALGHRLGAGRGGPRIRHGPPAERACQHEPDVFRLHAFAAGAEQTETEGRDVVDRLAGDPGDLIVELGPGHFGASSRRVDAQPSFPGVARTGGWGRIWRPGSGEGKWGDANRWSR